MYASESSIADSKAIQLQNNIEVMQTTLDRITSQLNRLTLQNERLNKELAESRTDNKRLVADLLTAVKAS